MKCRYTKVAAQKLTKTVIETAIAGGGGLVDTLRHSYSMNDLQGVQNSRPGSYDGYDNQGTSDRRVMPQSRLEGHSTGRITEPLKKMIVQFRQELSGDEGSHKLDH